MAQNPNITDLDFPQAVSRCIDPDNDVLRTTLHATGLEIALSAQDGDSVQTFNGNSIASVDLTSGNTGTNTQVLGPLSSTGYSKITAYVQSTNTITSGSPTITVQYSPATGGNVWVNSSVTATLSGTSGTTVMSIVDDKLLATRTRLLISAGLTGAETATAYILMSSS